MSKELSGEQRKAAQQNMRRLYKSLQLARLSPGELKELGYAIHGEKPIEKLSNDVLAGLLRVVLNYDRGQQPSPAPEPAGTESSPSSETGADLPASDKA